VNTQAIQDFGNQTLNQLRGAWDWWLAEITTMFPWLTAGAERGVADTVFVEFGQGSLNLYGYERGELSAAHTLPTDADGATALSTDSQAMLEDAAHIIARLPAALAIRTEVTLPRATSGNLRQVLGFEMDRHTPFSVDQVYYDFRIKRQIDQQIVIDLVVVRRAAVDGILDQLAAATVAVTGIDLDSAAAGAQAAPPIEFNLSPEDRVRRTRPGTSIINRWWPWALAALCAIALTLPLMVRHLAESNLAVELTESRAAAADVQRTREELNQKLVPITVFTGLRGQSPRSVDVLNEMTRLLPDNTWLSRFEIAGDKVSVQGESRDAAALIAIIEESELFSGARFSSPITRNPSTERDRFTIEATSVPGGEA
jgi:general secretion pathway protein L